jgi:CRP/FNR family transcriptional regulator, anaerobic regulatory protein
LVFEGACFQFNIVYKMTCLVHRLLLSGGHSLLHGQHTLRSTAMQAYNPLVPAADLPDTLDRILNSGYQKIVQEGQPIHSAGSGFDQVYYLKSGMGKRSCMHLDGREQILGFPLPGEFLGFEAIGTNKHSCTVLALDTCSVVTIPFARLEQLLAQDPQAMSLMYQRFASSLRSDQSWMMALGQLSAQERVATFLLDLSRRYAERGQSGKRFMLRMTRDDIGHFLGLTLETVSRMFSKLQRNGLLQIDCREVEICDLDALTQTAQAGA